MKRHFLVAFANISRRLCPTYTKHHATIHTLRNTHSTPLFLPQRPGIGVSPGLSLTHQFGDKSPHSHNYRFLSQIFPSKTFPSLVLSAHALHTMTMNFSSTPHSNNLPEILDQQEEPHTLHSQHMYEVHRNYDPETAALVDEIKEVIELRIAEAIRNDGGDIHFIQYVPEDKIVQLALSGACESCDKSAVTLQILVTSALKHYFPGQIEKVKRIRLPGQEERDIKENVFP